MRKTDRKKILRRLGVSSLRGISKRERLQALGKQTPHKTRPQSRQRDLPLVDHVAEASDFLAAIIQIERRQIERAYSEAERQGIDRTSR